MIMKYEPLLKHLAAQNSIHAPQLRLEKRGGYYKPATETIYMPIHLLAQDRNKVAIDFLLHEFTHHLTYIQYGRKMLTKENTHGITFTKNLIHVVQLHYGNVLEYGWQTEYRKVIEAMEMLPK